MRYQCCGILRNELNSFSYVLLAFRFYGLMSENTDKSIFYDAISHLELSVNKGRSPCETDTNLFASSVTDTECFLGDDKAPLLPAADNR